MRSRVPTALLRGQPRQADGPRPFRGPHALGRVCHSLGSQSRGSGHRVSFNKPQGKTGWQRGQRASTAHHPGDGRARPHAPPPTSSARGPASRARGPAPRVQGPPPASGAPPPASGARLPLQGPPPASGVPPPAARDASTYFVGIVEQQHLRDDGWWRQRAERGQLGAGRRLQLDPH